MIAEFLQHAKAHKLFNKNDKVLLTVSGGADSVCMATLFAAAGINCGIAHCNFGLRGKESDEDEDFVRNMALKMGFPFYSIRFDTLGFAKKEKLSTQMAARKLRYEWFEQLKTQHGYNKIATAHHANDFTETVLINLLRGSEYTTGIPIINQHIIRPLLFATRMDIEIYLGEAGLVWRNDSSNDEDKYIRNALRHRVIPELMQLCPELTGILQNSAKEAANNKQLLQQLVSEKKQIITEHIADCVKIKGDALTGALLKHLLQEYGFHDFSTKRFDDFLQSAPGKKLMAANHTLYSAGKAMWLAPSHRNVPDVYGELTGVDTGIENNFFTLTIKEEIFRPEYSQDKLYLNQTNTVFPLIARKRVTGDKYSPVGMAGSKKISDILIDLKTPEPLKDLYPVIVQSNGEIIGLVNYRPAAAYTPQPGETALSVQFELKKHHPALTQIRHT